MGCYIYDDDVGPGMCGNVLPGIINMSRDTSATSLLHAVSSSSASNASEVVSYLDCDTMNHWTDDLNILH